MRTCRASRNSMPAACFQQALTCQGLLPAGPQAPQGPANPGQPHGDAAPQPPAPWSPGRAPHRCRALRRGGGFLKRGPDPRPDKGGEPAQRAAQRRQRGTQDGRAAHTSFGEAGCGEERAPAIPQSTCKLGDEGKPELHAGAAWPADGTGKCCVARAGLQSADCALRDTPLGTGPGPPDRDVLLQTEVHAVEGACISPCTAVDASEARGSSERRGHAALRAAAPVPAPTRGPGAWLAPEQLLAARGDPTADAALALGCRLGDLAVNARVHGRDASVALAALRFALTHPMSRGRA